MAFSIIGRSQQDEKANRDYAGKHKTVAILLLLHWPVPPFYQITVNTDLRGNGLTNNKTILRIFLTALLVLLPVGNILAMSTHSIHLEWDYDQYSAPVDSDLSAYRLYKDGVKTCQFDYPYDFAGDCNFTSDNGLFNFTLTAVFEDGTESPHSAPFPFRLGPNTVVLTAVYGLLLGN